MAAIPDEQQQQQQYRRLPSLDTSPLLDEVFTDILPSTDELHKLQLTTWRYLVTAFAVSIVLLSATVFLVVASCAAVPPLVLLDRKNALFLSSCQGLILLWSVTLQQCLFKFSEGQVLRGYLKFVHGFRSFVPSFFSISSFSTAAISVLLVLSRLDLVYIILIVELLFLALLLAICWQKASPHLLSSPPSPPDAFDELVSVLRLSEEGQVIMPDKWHGQRAGLLERQLALLQYQQLHIHALCQEVARIQNLLEARRGGQQGEERRRSMEEGQRLVVLEGELAAVAAEAEHQKGEAAAALQQASEQRAEAARLQKNVHQYSEENARLRAMLEEWSARNAKLEIALYAATTTMTTTTTTSSSSSDKNHCKLATESTPASSDPPSAAPAVTPPLQTPHHRPTSSMDP